jgi:hypothetical protein
LARKPSRRPGRYCIRRSRVLPARSADRCCAWPGWPAISCVVVLGEPSALTCAAWAVRAVDQPRPLPGPDREQRGQRYPRVVAAGHRHHRGRFTSAPAPGAALRRPQALAGLVFPAEPGAQLGDLGRGELAFRAARALGRQRLPPVARQRPAPPFALIRDTRFRFPASRSLAPPRSTPRRPAAPAPAGPAPPRPGRRPRDTSYLRRTARRTD